MEYERIRIYTHTHTHTHTQAHKHTQTHTHTHTEVGFLLKFILADFQVFLKSDSHIPKVFFIICFNDRPSKMIKNVFLFHLKSSFRSQDI